MKTIFKTGDKVFDYRYGWGLVTDGPDEDNLIAVKFITDENTYYSDGTWDLNCVAPSLSFTEYTLKGFSQERPCKDPEIGSLCLFSDDLETFELNQGLVRTFVGRTKTGKYLSDHNLPWIYCKEIEITVIK